MFFVPIPGRTVTFVTAAGKGYQYLKAKGPVPYGMMNDYIFRIVFQENKYALKGLLCSLLHLKDDEIVNIEIRNTVKPGDSIAEKEYRLDILAYLNNDTSIDIEMQIKDYGNWQLRSLAYLCREFDDIEHGDDYEDVKTVYQIGFLDFDLFPDHPEFFATYQMRNAKDNHLYTDRFNLIVVSLRQEDIATEEDRACGIDTWVRLFKATTWEDLTMVAENNDYMASAIETVYRSNEDSNVRKIARERDDFLRYQAHREAKIAKQEKIIAEKDSIIAEKDNAIAEKDNAIAEKDNTMKELLSENAALKAELDKLRAKVSGT